MQKRLLKMFYRILQDKGTVESEADVFYVQRSSVHELNATSRMFCHRTQDRQTLLRLLMLIDAWLAGLGCLTSHA